MDPNDKITEQKVEQWLNSALAQYADAEPRRGLENRVLANLRAESERLATRRRRWGTLGTLAVATTIMLAVWIKEGGTRKAPTAENSPVQRQDDGSSKQKPPQPQPVRPPQAWARNRPAAPMSGDLAAAATPIAKQFPSPTPLSDQEKMLARYVQEFPHRAALMARAQTELRKQDQLEMAAPWPKNDDTGLEQQE